MQHNFDSGPGFRAMVQNVPEMAQNGKCLTTPTVLKLRSSSFRVMLTYLSAKNSSNRILIRVSDYGPKRARNGPKQKKSNYSNSFQGMMLNFLDNVDPPKAHGTEF